MTAEEQTKAKADGAYEAWLDLLSNFNEAQRMEIANYMAHGWTVNALRIERDGKSLVYTPDAVHGQNGPRKYHRKRGPKNGQ